MGAKSKGGRRKPPSPTAGMSVGNGRKEGDKRSEEELQADALLLSTQELEEVMREVVGGKTMKDDGDNEVEETTAQKKLPASGAGESGEGAGSDNNDSVAGGGNGSQAVQSTSGTEACGEDGEDAPVIGRRRIKVHDGVWVSCSWSNLRAAHISAQWVDYRCVVLGSCLFYCLMVVMAQSISAGRNMLSFEMQWRCFHVGCLGIPIKLCKAVAVTGARVTVRPDYGRFPLLSLRPIFARVPCLANYATKNRIFTLFFR